MDLSFRRDTASQVRIEGGSVLRRGEDLDAGCLCRVCQNLLVLNPIHCNCTNYDFDTLEGRDKGELIVIIDGGELGSSCDPFRVSRTPILWVRM